MAKAEDYTVFIKVMALWGNRDVLCLPIKKAPTSVRAVNVMQYAFSCLQNSIAFPYFGDEYVRNNLIGNGGRPCLFRYERERGREAEREREAQREREAEREREREREVGTIVTQIPPHLFLLFSFRREHPEEGCQIFRLGDMVQMAGGNFSR